MGEDHNAKSGLPRSFSVF